MPLEETGVSFSNEGSDAFIAAFEQSGEAAGSFESAVTGASAGIDVAGEIITGALRAVGEMAVSALVSAGEAVVGFLVDSFAGALEAEQNMARLGQVIESTGGIAGVTVADAEALADEFKNLAGGSDDAIISIIDMGLRMGTISEEQMPSFIQSTLDLGAVMGDAGKASQLMARAVEDPVGVLGALRKAGILVNETTEAQIKAMVASGDTAGAYALLMGRVEEATAGAAETMALTTAGQWAIFQETVADAGETIVGAFLPAIMGIAGPIMESVVPAISAFAETLGFVVNDLLGGDAGLAFDDLREGIFAIGTQLGFSSEQMQAFNGVLTQIWDWVEANLPLMQETFSTVFTTIQTVLQVLGDFVTITLMPALASIWEQTGIQLPTTQATFESVMAGIVVATQLVSDFITNVLVPVLTAAVDWVVTNWPAIQATAIEVWTQVQAAINTAVVFIQGLLDSFLPQITANISTTLSGLTAFWNEHGAAIMAIVSTSFETMASVIAVTLGLIGATVSTSLTLLSGLFATTMQLVNGDWSGAWTTIQDTITASLDGILALVGTDLESFTGVWTNNWEMAKTIVTETWNNMAAAISDSLTNIIASVISTVASMYDAFTSIDWIALGGQIIENVKTGVMAVAGSLAQAAADAAYAAYQAMLNALGIGSPSPMLMAIGHHFGADVGTGVSDSALEAVQSAERSASDMVAGLVDTLASAGPSLAAAANLAANNLVSPVKSALGYITNNTNNSVTHAPQFNLNATTSKPMQTVAAEFTSMQTLAGLA